MSLECDARFEEKLTCDLEDDMRNLENFRQSTRSLKIGTFVGSFYTKQKTCELKYQWGVMCQTMKNDSKFEKELTCQFKFDPRNLTNFDRST